MRAAVVDSRPVPPGVNLMPMLSTWTLAGGAAYDPETQEITLPAVGAAASSPLVRIDDPVQCRVMTEHWVPSGGDNRRLLTLSYRRQDGVTSGIGLVSGDAASTPTDQWATRAVPCPITVATYIRVTVSVTTAWGVPGTRYRRGSLTITR